MQSKIIGLFDHQPGKFFGRYWPAVVKSLILIAFEGLKKFEFLNFFNALGNGGQVQIFCQMNDTRHNGTTAIVLEYICYKRPVDF